MGDTITGICRKCEEETDLIVYNGLCEECAWAECEEKNKKPHKLISLSQHLDLTMNPKRIRNLNFVILNNTDMTEEDRVRTRAQIRKLQRNYDEVIKLSEEFELIYVP